MIESILKPWPWYISGPLIAAVMGLLLYFGKTFGMSSNLRTLCALSGGGRYLSFFKINWQDFKWNLMVVIGAVIGGFIAVTFLQDDSISAINPKTVGELNDMGFAAVGQSLVPDEIFALDQLSSMKSWVIWIIGGLLVGFGTRYAGGCTSGHAITGLSSLQRPSLIAVIGFFIGGLVMANLLLPLIF